MPSIVSPYIHTCAQCGKPIDKLNTYCSECLLKPSEIKVNEKKSTRYLIAGLALFLPGLALGLTLTDNPFLVTLAIVLGAFGCYAICRAIDAYFKGKRPKGIIAF